MIHSQCTFSTASKMLLKQNTEIRLLEIIKKYCVLVVFCFWSACCIVSTWHKLVLSEKRGSHLRKFLPRFGPLACKPVGH